MATLYAGTEAAVRMDTPDISTLLDGTVYDSSPTHLSLQASGGRYQIFGGTGFVFGPSGIFTAGTVTSIYISDGSGGEPMGVTGMSMSVAALKNYVATGNSTGFLAAVFAGNDTINGHGFFAFNDFLNGYAGHDKLNGGAGDDSLLGGIGNDTLNGGTGDDFIMGGAGTDKIYGGKGDDIIALESTLDTAIELAGEGTDAVITWFNVNLATLSGGHIENASLAGSANLNAVGSASANELFGNTGMNKLVGDLGNDTLHGDNGNDTIDGGGGADDMYGGNGNDVYYADFADLVDETGANGIDTVVASTDFSLLSTSGDVENLMLLAGTSDIDGSGNGLANKITGNNGENNLYGYGGNDTVVGGDGADYLNGGTGNDVLNGGLGNDTIEGGHGINTINVLNGNDVVRHQPALDAYDIIQNFDGDPAGGQDVFSLDPLFDSLGVSILSRTGRVQLTDKGATVDVRVDTNGDGTFDYLAATIYSANAITIGADVLTGAEGPIEVTI